MWHASEIHKVDYCYNERIGIEKNEHKMGHASGVYER